MRLGNSPHLRPGQTTFRQGEHPGCQKGKGHGQHAGNIASHDRTQQLADGHQEEQHADSCRRTVMINLYAPDSQQA